MPSFDAAHAFALDVMRVEDETGLSDLLRDVCSMIGCSWFALSHHIDFLAAPEKGIRVHNYPPEWAGWFDQRRLGLTDPVHRAAQCRLSGFLWHDMFDFLATRPQDGEILNQARRHGIGDGLSVPAHLPGEAHGSVSFAWAPREAATPEALYFAQMIGSHAFEAARLLAHPELRAIGPRLTDRQRECLIWSANGKSAWATSRILGLSQDTVKEHLRNARAKYGATDRTTLTTRALFGGDICFGDLASPMLLPRLRAKR
ncbi:LuxR family transcriptional regulator [Sphingopyxis panaciterrae]